MFKTPKFVLVLISLMLIVGLVPVQAQDGPDGNLPVSIITEAMTLTSSTNDQDYLIFVGLPLEYWAIDDPLPVLYVLDPQLSFGTITEMTRLAAAASELPALIVIGIGYPAMQQFATDQNASAVSSVLQLRERDYARQGQEDFLAFLTDELIPLIDSTYNTDPAERAIFGISHGGTFVLYALQHATESFNRYVALSPGSCCPEWELDNPTERSIHVFLAVGEYESDLLPVARHAFLALDALEYDWLQVAPLLVVEDSTHFTVPQATIRGLKYIYCRYSILCAEPIE